MQKDVQITILKKIFHYFVFCILFKKLVLYSECQPQKPCAHRVEIRFLNFFLGKRNKIFKGGLYL